MKELFTRRSVRKYLPTKVKEDDIKKLLKAGMYAIYSHLPASFTNTSLGSRLLYLP